MPRGWSKYKEGTLAYIRANGEMPKQRKKPFSQVEAEERREIENKKKKFTEFLSVMMAKGKKAKTQTWNESFNDFVPSNQLKSRRERKREEKLQKEQEENEEEQGNQIKVGKKEVIEAEGGITIVQKEINRKSTKLGAKKAKQIHIKFGGKADINAAMEKIEDQLETQKEQDQKDEEIEEGEGEEEGEEIDQNRLFVMNLPFEITEEELREYFGKYGEIDEISIPLRRGGVGTGF